MTFSYVVLKRLYEFCQVEPTLAEQFAHGESTADAEGLLSRLKVNVQPAEVKKLFAKLTTNSPTENPFLAAYLPKAQKIHADIDVRIAREQFTDPAFFRNLQITRNRIFLEEPMLRSYAYLRYYPLAWELSDGCGVQCPFCGLEAPALKKHFSYTKTNAALWKEVLIAAKELVGQVCASAPCYFATEPLENPDYKRFLTDFRSVFGTIPQTTTAIAERDPEQFRAFLAWIGKKELADAAVRISIRNRAQFYAIMSAYSPEELEDIELLPNNPESVRFYAASGRAKEKTGSLPYSISCIAGILVNMVRCTVSFVEPETPSEQFPTGIRIHESRQFSDAAEFRQALRVLLNMHVRDEIQIHDHLSFNTYTTLAHQNNEYTFTQQGMRCRMRVNKVLSQSLELCRKGTTLAEISKNVGINGFVLDDVKQKLDMLYTRGYLRCIHSGATV
ncbi:MAG: radical SAM family RiPP maturation amino acid epimerase [Treponema sp.]|nr:radical SAM family RiPP maturation amino acid epimerase [Treponema sp.]